MQSILADNYFWLPRQASTVAGPSDDLFNAILWLCVFFFLLVTVLLVAFVIKFRHRPGVKRDVGASHNMTLELTWTIIPSIIVVFLYYYGFKEYMNLAIEPPNAYSITATGQMWQWSFTYPEGYSDGELHVPVNTPIRVVLQSNDVIHSLSIPDFRVKKDVVPGRYNRLWFQATDADGAVYVTSVNVNGKMVDVAVDTDGKPLSQAGHTPGETLLALDNKKDLPAPAHDAILAHLAGAAVPGSTPVETYALLNGARIFLMHLPGSTPDVFVDAKGNAPEGQVKPFSELPSNVQHGLAELTPGGSIPPAQQVHVFPDAMAFDIFCTDYCGTNHSTMRSRVIVHRSQADFDTWLKNAIDSSNSGTPADKGLKLYTKFGCAQCHSLDGTARIGPSWMDLYGSTQKFTDGTSAVVDDEYVRQFIPNPIAHVPVGYPPVMPPFVLSADQLNSITAYLKTISKNYHASMSPGVGVAPGTQPTTAPATEPAAK